MRIFFSYYNPLWCVVLGEIGSTLFAHDAHWLGLAACGYAGWWSANILLRLKELTE